MPNEMLAPMIVGITVFALLAAIIIFQIVWFKRMQKKYVYRWQSHEIVFEMGVRSARLYVDGNIEDELGAQNVRVCTLRAFVDGTEIKAHMAIRRMRVELDVTAGNTPLQLIGVGK